MWGSNWKKSVLLHLSTTTTVRHRWWQWSRPSSCPIFNKWPPLLHWWWPSCCCRCCMLMLVRCGDLSMQCTTTSSGWQIRSWQRWTRPILWAHLSCDISLHRHLSDKTFWADAAAAQLQLHLQLESAVFFQACHHFRVFPQRSIVLFHRYDPNVHGRPKNQF